MNILTLIGLFVGLGLILSLVFLALLLIVLMIAGWHFYAIHNLEH